MPLVLYMTLSVDCELGENFTSFYLAYVARNILAYFVDLINHSDNSIQHKLNLALMCSSVAMVTLRQVHCVLTGST